MTDLNGHAGQSPQQTFDPGAIAKTRELIDAQIRQVIGVNIRGLLVSAPGVAPHEMLNAIARVTGGLLAESIVADLSVILRMRTGFKEAFADGIAKTPPKQPAINPATILRRQ